MADDKKNIPDAAPPTEAPAPTVEAVAAPEPPAPEAPKPEKEQTPAPIKNSPAPERSGKVADFAAARDEAAMRSSQASTVSGQASLPDL